MERIAMTTSTRPPEVPPRPTEADAGPLFSRRWSPRAFSPEPIGAGELAGLFEAARHSPSCFNEQPWLFAWAGTPADLERWRSALSPANRRWADRAPVLVFLFAKRRFAHNGKPNRWAGFDAGAAWMSLALEAERRGLATHAMGGFDVDLAHAATGVPEDEFEAMAAIAVGRRDLASVLPDDLAVREKPSPRRPLASVAFEGGYAPEGSRS